MIMDAEFICLDMDVGEYLEKTDTILNNIDYEHIRHLLEHLFELGYRKIEELE